LDFAKPALDFMTFPLSQRWVHECIRSHRPTC